MLTLVPPPSAAGGGQDARLPEDGQRGHQRGQGVRVHAAEEVGPCSGLRAGRVLWLRQAAARAPPRGSLQAQRRGGALPAQGPLLGPRPGRRRLAAPSEQLSGWRFIDSPRGKWVRWALRAAHRVLSGVSCLVWPFRCGLRDGHREEAELQHGPVSTYEGPMRPRPPGSAARPVSGGWTRCLSRWQFFLIPSRRRQGLRNRPAAESSPSGGSEGVALPPAPGGVAEGRPEPVGGLRSPRRGRSLATPLPNASVSGCGGSRASVASVLGSRNLKTRPPVS